MPLGCPGPTTFEKLVTNPGSPRESRKKACNKQKVLKIDCLGCYSPLPYRWNNKVPISISRYFNILWGLMIQGISYWKEGF